MRGGQKFLFIRFSFFHPLNFTHMKLHLPCGLRRALLNTFVAVLTGTTLASTLSTAQATDYESIDNASGSRKELYDGDTVNGSVTNAGTMYITVDGQGMLTITGTYADVPSSCKLEMKISDQATFRIEDADGESIVYGARTLSVDSATFEVAGSLTLSCQQGSESSSHKELVLKNGSSMNVGKELDLYFHDLEVNASTLNINGDTDEGSQFKGAVVEVKTGSAVNVKGKLTLSNGVYTQYSTTRETVSKLKLADSSTMTLDKDLQVTVSEVTLTGGSEMNIKADSRFDGSTLALTGSEFNVAGSLTMDSALNGSSIEKKPTLTLKSGSSMTVGDTLSLTKTTVTLSSSELTVKNMELATSSTMTLDASSSLCIAGGGSVTVDNTSRLTLRGSLLIGTDGAASFTVGEYLSSYHKITGDVTVGKGSQLTLTGQVMKLSSGQDVVLMDEAGFTGDLTTASGATLSMQGESSLTGTLTLNGGTLELDAAAGTPAVQKVVTGTSVTQVAVTDLCNYAPGSYTILSYGEQSITAGKLSLAPVSTEDFYDYTLSQTENTLQIQVAVQDGVLVWKSGSGAWATEGAGTPWESAEGAAAYTDGDKVVLQDGEIAISGEVAPAAILMQGGGDVTISGSGHIVGDASLLMLGSGTLTIGTANAYTGGTIIENGVLDVQNASALGSGPITVKGGTLLGSELELTNHLELSGGTVSNKLSGEGAVVKTGSGTASLSGSNVHTGGTTIQDGTLQALSETALGSGKVTLNAGALALGDGVRLSVSEMEFKGGSVQAGENSSLAVEKALTLADGSKLTASTVMMELGDVCIGKNATLEVGADSVIGSADSPAELTIGDGSTLSLGWNAQVTAGDLDLLNGARLIAGNNSVITLADVTVGTGSTMTIGSSSTLSFDSLTLGEDAEVKVDTYGTLSVETLYMAQGSTLYVWYGDPLSDLNGLKSLTMESGTSITGTEILDVTDAEITVLGSNAGGNVSISEGMNARGTTSILVKDGNTVMMTADTISLYDSASLTVHADSKVDGCYVHVCSDDARVYITTTKDYLDTHDFSKSKWIRPVDGQVVSKCDSKVADLVVIDPLFNDYRHTVDYTSISGVTIWFTLKELTWGNVDGGGWKLGGETGLWNPDETYYDLDTVHFDTGAEEGAAVEVAVGSEVRPSAIDVTGVNDILFKDDG